jgi:hypothetical protein
MDARAPAASKPAFLAKRDAVKATRDTIWDYSVTACTRPALTAAFSAPQSDSFWSA